MPKKEPVGITILREVRLIMDWDLMKALTWYRTKNPMFGNVSAEDLVKCGRGHKVLQFIEYAEEENHPPISKKRRKKS
jgi:hypothetical protein